MPAPTTPYRDPLALACVPPGLRERPVGDRIVIEARWVDPPRSWRHAIAPLLFGVSLLVFWACGRERGAPLLLGAGLIVQAAILVLRPGPPREHVSPLLELMPDAFRVLEVKYRFADFATFECTPYEDAPSVRCLSCRSASGERVRLLEFLAASHADYLRDRLVAAAERAADLAAERSAGRARR